MRASRRGQSLVESTLVLLVFVALILGFLDVGQLMFAQQSLTDRMRMAARWAAVRPYDEPSIRNMVLYLQPEPAASAFLGLTASNVQVTRLDESIRIAIVDYEFPVISPWFSGRLSPRPVVATQEAN